MAGQPHPAQKGCTRQVSKIKLSSNPPLGGPVRIGPADGAVGTVLCGTVRIGPAAGAVCTVLGGPVRMGPTVGAVGMVPE